MAHRRRTSHVQRPCAPAFTLVELLVALAVIALLVSILAVTMSSALTSSKRAATGQQLSNIALALEQFKQDFGYYPPLLNDDPADLDTNERLTVPETREELEDARWHSIFTLPFYVVGQGDLNGDENDMADELDLDDGLAGPGFRDPGVDRSWGGAANRDEHAATQTGRTFGPYMNVSDNNDLFRRVRESDFRRNRDSFEDDSDEEEKLYVFVDRWDNPIRFYQSWPKREREGADRDLTLTRAPLELIDPAALRREEPPDVSSDRDLLNAPFALLSAGPNGYWGERVEEDTENDPDNEAFLVGADFPSLSGETDDAGENAQLKLSTGSAQNPGFLDDNIRVLP